VQLSLEAVVLFTEPRARQQQEHDWSRYFLLTVSTSSPLIESSRSTTHYESGQAEEVKKILKGAGMHLLNGQSYETNGVAFVGVKGFIGGFGRRMLASFGETVVKSLVAEAVNEAMRLENAMRAVRSERAVVVLHYAPILDTVEGEPLNVEGPCNATEQSAQAAAKFWGVSASLLYAHQRAPAGSSPYQAGAFFGRPVDEIGKGVHFLRSAQFKMPGSPACNFRSSDDTRVGALWSCRRCEP
jgi:hypothetical protein